jgi:hypothetical protein
MSHFSFAWSELAEPPPVSEQSNWKAIALSARNTPRQKRNQFALSRRIVADSAHESVGRYAKPYGRRPSLTNIALPVSNPLNAIQVLAPVTRRVLRDDTRRV